MRLHFFTVNDIEDYRKHYGTYYLAKKTFDEAHPRTPEDFDQEFFFRLIKEPFNFSDAEVFESEIYGETGIEGLRLDFNFGLRLDVPEGNFRVRIGDFDTGDIFFDKYISGGRLISVEQYFIRWHVEVFLNEEKIFAHTLNLENQPVAVLYKSSAIGDSLALLPYIAEFKKFYRCELSVYLPEYLRSVAARLYPELPQVDKINFETYAIYHPFMLHSQFPLTPAEYRKVQNDQASYCPPPFRVRPAKREYQPTADYPPP